MAVFDVAQSVVDQSAGVIISDAGIDISGVVGDLIAIVMFNAGIRRFTALNIISHLKEAGILKKDSKAYVNFIWTKFQVKENGLATEYRYSELFFIKALVSAFTDFANASAENINEFCNNNDIDVSRLNNAADSADKDDSAK